MKLLLHVIQKEISLSQLIRLLQEKLKYSLKKNNLLRIKTIM
jgi:hypothetical protein